MPMEPAAWLRPNRPLGQLGGRTITASSISDIHLAPREVVLTFDDGPMPGKTERILATLDRYGVKATFLMVGQMAKSYPSIARKVAEQGHSIGSHTWGHPNLKGIAYDQAINQITKGELAVRSGAGVQPGFFRFPYLADTPRLRSALAHRGTVVLDVSIDSKDYFTSQPSEIVERTMAALHRRGNGVILMHDIHSRTVNMLPMLLQRLKSEGYKVVTLQYARSRMPMLAAAF
ncbi:hypothetical protein GCM10007920_23050 [Ciceribacter naphthalenivorans]|uniref:Chitooligosaccharide deacetylase n=2 Tax=Alphaproteobacteria TaxID=28211 RepID=A0A512HGH5_9HYPH|nr:hypothetical protein RNA01_14870 [Ciceribacter naphthalenivorans]GLR22518.1 hypothetical protein GCM10007920_23050 [Ciceribacter naphthalenivorans]GLT05374.1 hypothetical protein GCM10007926_23050 [Sphingomonas psychrolutea]